MTQKYIKPTIAAIALAFVGSVVGIVAAQGAPLPIWIRSAWVTLDFLLLVYVLVKDIAYVHRAQIMPQWSSEDQGVIMAVGIVGGIATFIFIGISFSLGIGGYTAISCVFFVLLSVSLYLDFHWPQPAVAGQVESED